MHIIFYITFVYYIAYVETCMNLHLRQSCCILLLSLKVYWITLVVFETISAV